MPTLLHFHKSTQEGIYPYDLAMRLLQVLHRNQEKYISLYQYLNGLKYLLTPLTVVRVLSICVSLLPNRW